jgi:hypothetical protein
MRRSLTVAIMTLALVLGVTMTALALDVWSGFRDCLPGWDLKVISYGTGTVQHFKNGNLTGSWNNGVTAKWRVTYQGDEAQEVVISATGELTQQSAVCVCLPGHSCVQWAP